MRQAEKLIGIEYGDAEESMALGGVNRNLGAYETVRKIEIPLDTEPAIFFHPARAKRELYSSKTKFRFSKVEPPSFKNGQHLGHREVDEHHRENENRKKGRQAFPEKNRIAIHQCGA